MVTSAEFDKVLVPVDYQKDVLFRTFDTLIGFNKKNKKGKFMKAIKEEWTYDPKTGKQVFVDRQKANDEKTAHFKRVNLDQKMSKPSVTAAKPKVARKKDDSEKLKELEAKERKGRSDIIDSIYRNTIIKGQDKNDPEKGVSREEARQNAIKQADAYLDSKKIPNDTHYTIDEIVDMAWKLSKKTREHFASTRAFKEALIKSKKLRDMYDKRLIEKKGHKPEDEKKATRKTNSEKIADLKEKAELEKDPHKIADWFWAKKDDPSFKVMFPDVKSYNVLFRMIQNGDKPLSWYAKIMRDRGYVSGAEKPFVRKAVLIKKGDAACDWEKEGEAAVDFDEKDSDTVWNNIKSFFTSWAKECGYKLTPEALKKFKENVYKSIIYYNTMYILKGDK